jgi:sigma-54 dependent transcriptional regulator, acetoin dehydrogenase operon transcriptional activator AcoR
MSGLDPGAPVGHLDIEDVDRRSRLVIAAAPVLDEMAEDLDGTGFAVMLADRRARLVDLRFGDPALRPRVERVGAVPGYRFVEETTGTNSIATTFEVRRGVAVHGEEHFIESLKKFSCYGHPVLHPVTRRLEGVLDITCLAEHDNPLLAPFLVRAAARIEERLLGGAREAEQRILAAFQHAQLRGRSVPVVAVGDDVLLANTAATELLDAADHAVLRGTAVDASAGRPVSCRLTLSTGQEVLAAIERVPGGAGAVFVLEPVAIPRSTTIPRRGSAPVLVHGEPGSGRTTAVRDLAGGEPVSVLDAGDVPVVGRRAWVATLDNLLGTASLVAVEAVHLLPEALARRVAVALPTATGRVVLTSGPVAELSGEHASLAAHCAERIELRPLRRRRDEIPALVGSMLAALGSPRELRFTPGALEALAGQDWPGNMRELFAVVRQVAETRQVGDVVVGDLPEAYRGRARCRLLTPMERAERDAIVEVLRATGGNKKDAARRLGISRTTLYNAIRAFGIVAPVSRS